MILSSYRTRSKIVALFRRASIWHGRVDIVNQSQLKGERDIDNIMIDTVSYFVFAVPSHKLKVYYWAAARVDGRNV